MDIKKIGSGSLIVLGILIILFGTNNCFLIGGNLPIFSFTSYNLGCLGGFLAAGIILIIIGVFLIRKK